MSRGLSSQQQMPRDYGATSSSSNAITSIPDVNFSGFSPTEFMALNEAIGKNITTIKFKTNLLVRYNRGISSGRADKDKDKDKDSIETAQKMQTDTNLLIEQTQNDLKTLTNVVRRGDKYHKLQLEKLTTDFVIVVEKYSKAQQTIATKRKQLLALSQQDEQNSENMSESDRQQLIQQQKELGRALKFEQEIQYEREEEIKKIEGVLLDVNKIMKDISVIVNMQGEQINTIEVEIDNTAANVEEAASELQKASANRQSYRRKILILLIIAVIIGLIVTAIVVSKLKS
ncbi:uncharacterized protein LOC129610265 [Condylostylus longicornis]|uniref:uncharacterized protein LOC129610265 n=1 Tax=Condylostylus longicornis TaxID=2530218 RepID=UPI00244DBA69|nr:uncharacterized protein LOC129610265 [Condylostylus longicornis]XP_055378760.1 uncharacterized protein LOC129610265 [Condylostylus longicornis]